MNTIVRTWRDPMCRRTWYELDNGVVTFLTDRELVAGGGPLDLLEKVLGATELDRLYAPDAGGADG